MSCGRGVLGRLVLVLPIAILSLAPSAAAQGNGRVLEQVTPADKPGQGLAILGGFNIQPDGNGLAYGSAGAIHPDDQASGLNMYIGRRGASSWQATPISPVNTSQQILSAPLPLDISNDLTKSIWLSLTPIAPGGPGTPANPVLGAYSGTPGGPFTFLTAIGFISGASWATADLSHVAFTTTDDGTPNGVNVAQELVGSQIRDVSVPPAGGDPFCGAQIGEFVGPGEGEQNGRNAVSPDGSRIFFTGTPCGGTQRVYVRENAAVTRELSESECTRADCNTPSDVVYHGASKDGSTVVMSSAQQLTDDDTNSSWDVYSVDVASGGLTRISVDPADLTVNTRAEDSWITGMSEDAGTVYFVAEGVLAPGATDGQKNLYVSRDGAITFIATLELFDFQARSGHSTGAYVTPSGNHFAFMTEKSLVPEDTDTQNQTHDIYLYDRVAGTLTFASPGADEGRGVQLAEPQADGRGMSNVVSEDGSHVFLFSPDPMTPDDENLSFDFFEFANGQVSLISGGKADNTTPPIFVGATPSGSDFFFVDRAQLLDSDIDGLPDVYDARIGGGFPPPDRTVQPPPGCREDACQGPGAGPPARPGIESLTVGPEARQRVVFRLARIGSRARRRFARTGRLTLRVRVGEGGDLAAAVRARLGRRTVSVARDTVEADGAGTYRLTLRLSRRARNALEENGRLRVTIRVSFSEANRARSTRLLLRAPQADAGRRGR
jgi:WD40-like Beta Propeller Repeat